MQELSSLIQPYLAFLVPPLVGAFIGYLTNRIAIKMLFRPLKPWRIFGFRLPMTPGVIPAKRHELAVNMGQMVGEHLLTSEEVGKAIKKQPFQDQLLQLIQKHLKNIVEKDLAALTIPGELADTLTGIIATVKNRIKQHLGSYLQSPEFEQKLNNEIEKGIEQFLSRDFCRLLPQEARPVLLSLIDSKVETIARSQQLQSWLKSFIAQKVYLVLQQGNSLADIFPASTQTIIGQAVQDRVPDFLEKLADLTTSPLVRDKIVAGVKEGIAGFTAELGPMAAMVNNFLTEELIEQKVLEYLTSKEDAIKAGIQQEQIQEKLASIIASKTEQLLQEPLVNFLAPHGEEKVDELCKVFTEMCVQILHNRETSNAIAALLKKSIEDYLAANPSVKEVIIDLAGTEQVQDVKNWLFEELSAILKGSRTQQLMATLVDHIVDGFIAKPGGKLSTILPEQSVDDLSLWLRKLFSDLLVSETPGIVQALHIETIVTEKIDSLDLLKLETLLLSIMEEQFKYINLFGALLGFIIGCCNIFIIYLL